ncbi:putative telomere-associated protein RIF1-like [Apostichopus japonicus]|uniref:Putative telomere-associated protein RIF1-like n=1 Tax=Stichopus japonicus TaxID=307972 RepID=A0A2G8KYZ2_STIJA|nr:putative telomere-associated protein RIF1-like [Apostichopus japonicus]
MNVEDGENNTSRNVKEVLDEKEVESLPKNRKDSVNWKEEMEINGKEASIDSESQSRSQESIPAVQTQVSTCRSEDRNSQKESNSRRRRRLNRSVSPKIRRNLCEKFLKAKQVSPKSTSFHGFVTRRRSPKRSPKLLRSKGLLGPIHTRLRSKAGHLKRISPKQRRSIRRRNSSQSKSVTSAVATLNDSFDDLVKLSYDGEPMDNVTLERGELEEAKLIDADSSLTTEDCNALTIQEKDVVVTMETNSPQEHVPTCNSTTTSEAAIQDSGSSVDLFQSDSAEDSEENEKTAEVNAEPESLPVVSEKNIPKIDKVIENVIENTGLTNEEDCSEEIIHSSYSPTSLTSNVDDLNSGSQGSTRHAGMQQYLTGKDTNAAKLQPASPVIPVKFAPVIHSSPVATAKVTSSSHGSPEVLGIPGVYSPTASPSGGILKKREDGGSNSPSPTNKNRRVKFSEKVSTKEIENCTPSRSEKRRHSSDSSSSSRTSSKLMPSPLVTTTPSRVLNVHSKFITTPSKAADDNVVKTTGSSRHLVGRKSRSPRPKHAFFRRRRQRITGECFPKAARLQAPVEEILPQLTSSMWSRGLGQLVRARNIFTIGQLSALTPSEVQSLPIRSPKVSHLKWVLGQYLQRLQSKNQTDNTADKGSSEAENQPSTSGKEDGESSSLSLKRKRHDDDTAPESSEPKKVKLVEQLEKLSNGLSDELKSVSPNELFKAHEHINAMMDAIMNVLKTKYQPSSKPS